MVSLSTLPLFGQDRPDLLRPETLPDIFENTAKCFPNQVALIFEGKSFTYRELDHAADCAAHHLIHFGIRPGQFVGLWLPRGIQLLVMQLAISKAGAAWLPFDADAPRARIQDCLLDAGATAIILETQDSGDWPIDTLNPRDLATEPTGTWLRCTERLSTHPAYAIYTSGSTGKPKGIVIQHESICHFLRSENSILGITTQDRVYQGFSVAFDMSFEEIWISWLVGATLWIAPKTLANDPEALPEVLEREGITVLHAVPTLVALFPKKISSLRILNLGGETCPESLVDRVSSPGCALFNTYGPTETTVSATITTLQLNRPVTIGKPLPNYGALLLNEEGKLCNAEESGELCIFGPGVGQGYLGRPELTAEKFIDNPWARSPKESRLYRTGDLVRVDLLGEIHYLGRIDNQVKIRGFRVELGEIEAVLAQQPGVSTSAVVMRREQEIDQLVAFCIADQNHTATWRKALKDKLPPYMVPNHFEVLSEMPRLASGKIDRKALAVLPLVVSEEVQTEEPTTEAETVLFAALKHVFPGQLITRKADFFDDLGGHSLLAARLVSFLRRDSRFARITLGEIYRLRSVGQIADALEIQSSQSSKSSSQETSIPPVWKKYGWQRTACGFAQGITLPFLVCLHIAHWLAPFFVYHYLTGDPDDSILWASFSSILVFILGQLLAFVVAILGSRTVGRGITPGRYPLWGMTYFRWWLSERLVEVAPVYLLSGCSLQTYFLRALGAEIGSEVIIGSFTLRVPTLLTIEEGASLGNVVNLENASVERGELVVGRIHIGREASVGSYSILEGNTSVGAFSKLDGLSSLSKGEQIPDGEHWLGAPARLVGYIDPMKRPRRPSVSRSRIHMETVGYVLGALLVAVLFFIPIFPTFIIVDALDDNFLTGEDSAWLVAIRYFLLAIPASAALILLTALLSAAIRWIALPKLSPSSWPIHSGLYYRKWLANQIQECSMHILHGVYATVYAPWWYRLLGAKVGKNAEISTAMGVVPDMLTLGDETFIADAVMLGDDEIEGGWMTMQPTVVGHRSFVGNGAYVPDGTVIPENALIGVQSYAPKGVQEGETWVGSPAIRLPARETVGGFPDSLTFQPPWYRKIVRGLVETIRIVLPLAFTIGVGYLIVLRSFEDAVHESFWVFAWDLAVGGLIYGAWTFLFILLLKWVVIGRYVPRAVPMWASFVWLSEAVTSLYEAISVPNLLNFLRGTPMLPVLLRVLGVHIGRGTYLDTTDFTEFDCVEIGDYSELNAWSGPQTHLFEDRIMKIGRVKIGSRCTLGACGTVLYGAEVGDGASLGPLTLVLKGEHIPPETSWTGSPAQPTG
ncbi:Non-ribosomal peptide synthetase-like protein [Gammaproteobacteria bacterium]